MKKAPGNAGMKVSVNKAELGGQPVEPGIYEARINSELGTSASDKPMAKVTYTLYGNQPSGKTAVGRKIIDNCVIQQNTLWKLNQPYEAIQGETLPEGDFTIDELYQIFKDVTENQRVSIQVIIEPYEKKDGTQGESNRVQKIL